MTKNEVKIKFTSTSYVSNIMKLLNLVQPTKVLPVETDFYDMAEKIKNCDDAYTDGDDYSTVALSSNPTSFSSVDESAEEYFEKRVYSFSPTKFKMLTVLGQGSFGQVFLADYENDKENDAPSGQYAVKKLKKQIIDDYEMSQIMEEKRILEQLIECPFILRLYGFCQSIDETMFVTEVLESGDFFQFVYDGDRLTHDMCVFYGSGIVLGLNYIHSKGIVYRDLKPENIMLTANGYPKIIDFGLAKQVPYTKISSDGSERTYSRCYTLCGTPEYVAPELILGKGYDSAVDLWSLGILIYEMIFRATPFVDPKNPKDITKIFTNVIFASKNGILLPTKMDRKTDGTTKARDLVTQLLSGKKEDRMGKVDNLLDHPYFLSTGLDRDDLYKQLIPAP